MSRLLALGDSITVGEGSAMPGCPCRPWVAWLADALALELVNLAANGAQVRDVLDAQTPRAQGSFALACLYVGVNDARSLSFDPYAFATDLDAAAAAVRGRADRLLMVTVPLDLGRPRAGAKVLEANSIIRRVAGAHGATLVSNEGRPGWQHVQPDAVHLTALGQRALAAAALSELRAAGLLNANQHVPGGERLILPLTQALRYAVTGRVPAVWHDLRRRAREGTLW